MTTDIFTLCLDPSGDESVGALLVGGGHGGVQLELLRPACHAPAAGLGILPARAQWDELCPILVQGGDNIYISTVRTVLLYYNHKSIKTQRRMCNIGLIMGFSIVSHTPMAF